MNNKKTRRASDVSILLPIAALMFRVLIILSNLQQQIGKGPDWEQQREKEEKLVADIIDRVKRECEAQGETVTRRGYSRRSTVMNS